MSSSYVSFSSPAIRKCTHANTTVGTTFTTLLTPPTLPTRRILVIIQNQSATAVIEVVFDDTATVGIQVQPYQSISLENYNGTIRVKSTAAGTIVHCATANI
jgi:uncharacterized protein (DUF111 family)